VKDIYTELVGLEETYKTGSIDIVDGLPFNQNNLIKTIEFYTNSSYLNGEKDELGRDKPFHNIVNANVDIAIVATDIDTKDIKIMSKDTGMKGFVKSFLLTKEAELWMREVNFSKTLNEMGECRARYGGLLVKKCIEGDQVRVGVVQWKNVFTDASDILNNPIVEVHYFTPSQLQDKSDVWDNTDEAIKLFKKTDKKIKVYEIHGMFPEPYLKGDFSDSDSKYTQQVHVLACAGKKWVELFKDEEKENPYKYLTWKYVSGRALGRGVVEEGMEAQVWTNDSVMAERDIMALSGKLLLQTASKKYNGRNALNEVVTGTILETEDNRPITQVDLTPRTIPVFESLVDRWQKQFDRSTSITDSLRGETPPSGQAYRLSALVTQQSASSFDYRREEMGIFIKEIFYDWILPHLSKRLKKKHTLDAEFTLEELAFIDESYVNYLTMKELEKANKEGRGLDIIQIQAEMANAKEKMTKTKARRFLQIPEGYLDGKYTVDIVTTGEQMNKTATLESLSNILTVVAQNPMVLQDSVLREVFGRIVEISGLGISPVQLMAKPQQMMQQQQQGPQGQMVQPQSTSSLPNPQEVAPEAQQ
jgi:hypothetical protein